MNKKTKYILGAVAITFSLVGSISLFVKHTKTSDKISILDTNVSENLLQIRIQLIELLAHGEKNDEHAADILNLIQIQCQKTTERLISQQESSKTQFELIQRTITNVHNIQSFAKNANEQKYASKKEAIELTTELTNLILEWNHLQENP